MRIQKNVKIKCDWLILRLPYQGLNYKDMMSDDINFFATSIIASVTALSLYKVFSFQSRISDNNKLINKISTTPIKSPDDFFVNGQTAIVKGTVSRNSKDNRNDRIVVKTASGKTEEYILHLKYKEAIYSNENFSNKQQYVINLKELMGRADVVVSPSFLINGPTKSIVVSNYDQADYSRMLDITKWDNKKRRLTFTEKLQVLMLSYFRALGTLVVADRGRPTYLRGIDVGTREIQTSVKVGASIMALGTIGLNLQGEVSLQPNILFKDRLSIVTNLKEIVTGDENSRNFWLVVLLLGGIYVGRRIYKYQQKNDFISKIKGWGKKQPKPATTP